MGLGVLVAFVVSTCLVILHPTVVTGDNQSSIFDPIFNFTKGCDGIDCGKGTCKPAKGIFVQHVCECEPGWKQFGIQDDMKFMPCVIPNCTVNFSCTEAPAPTPAPSPPSKNDIFDPCRWAYCGKGTCKKQGLGHSCECENGSANILNITYFPCFNECALSGDCADLNLRVPNGSSPTPSLPDRINDACIGRPRNLYWSIIMAAMVSLPFASFL